MSRRQEKLVTELRRYGEHARPSGSGIHVPQYGRMTLTQAQAFLHHVILARAIRDDLRDQLAQRQE